MSTEIFIVSYAKHFPWLSYCLQSTSKFATGFSGITVLIPRGQESQLPDDIKNSTSYKICLGDEWPGRGMTWHMAQIMRADQWCPQADFILHTDSDCLFTEPVTPDDYFVDGKPVLYYERFSTLTKKHPDVGVWQRVTQECLPFPVLYETMRRHPAVHHRNVYAEARGAIVTKTKQPVDDYIKSCREEYPNGFCEFVTLGNVVMHQEHLRKQYHLVDTAEFKNGWPRQKICQFWSHSPPHIPQRPTFRGEPFECTPEQLLKMT